MEKKKNRKRLVTLSLAILLASSMIVPTLAGMWSTSTQEFDPQKPYNAHGERKTRWVYGGNFDNPYAISKWEWIDEDNDGIAKNYYFDERGFLLLDTMTPDGFTVNEEGEWTVDGVVQTKQLSIGNIDWTENGDGGTPTSAMILNALTITGRNDKGKADTSLMIDTNRAEVSSGVTNIYLSPDTFWQKNGRNGWIYQKCKVKPDLQDNYYAVIAVNEEGYLYVNTTTPDGYTVNAYGMLTIDGEPVLHTEDCRGFPVWSEFIDSTGKTFDKNHGDLSLISPWQYYHSQWMESFMPFGNLVYEHVSYRFSHKPYAISENTYCFGHTGCVIRNEDTIKEAKQLRKTKA